MFTLQQNTSDPDQWVTNDVESYGSAAYYGGTPLTEELAARIQEQVSGIKGYNATYTNYTVPVDASGETLTLLDTKSSESGLDSLLAGYGDFSSSVATYASTDTRLTVISPEDTWNWWQADTSPTQTPTALSSAKIWPRPMVLLWETPSPYACPTTRPPCWDMIPMTPVWR